MIIDEEPLRRLLFYQDLRVSYTLRVLNHHPDSNSISKVNLGGEGPSKGLVLFGRKLTFDWAAKSLGTYGVTSLIRNTHPPRITIGT
jgi:hypothetical protein